MEAEWKASLSAMQLMLMYSRLLLEVMPLHHVVLMVPVIDPSQQPWLQVHNLYHHYQHAAKSVKKLNISSLSSCLVNSGTLKCGQVPTSWHPQARIYCSVSTQAAADPRVQKAIWLRRLWARAGLVPELLASPNPVLGRWQHVQMV